MFNTTGVGSIQEVQPSSGLVCAPVRTPLTTKSYDMMGNRSYEWPVTNVMMWSVNSDANPTRDVHSSPRTCMLYVDIWFAYYRVTSSPRTGSGFLDIAQGSQFKVQIIL